MHERNTISALRISLASPEQIRQWSHGEVTKPDTINYLTHEPEPGGLCCERIFGPTRDWSCACGKYRHIQQANVACEKCGVELAPATVRRERMGHIELAAPVVHPWFLHSGSPLGLLLNLSSRQLAMVIAFQNYLVLSVDKQARAQILAETETAASDRIALLAALQPGMLLDAIDYELLSLHAGHLFQAKTGAEALRDALDALDLERLAHDLRQALQAADGAQHTISARLQTVEAFRASGLCPSWMILTVLAVLPADLRPIVSLDSRLAASDVNALYARVIHRNMRLKHCMERHVPTPIVNHERRLLQYACNALFENAHLPHPVPVLTPT